MKTIKAFTLVELMIVIAIVGIISMVAAPSFRAYLSNSQSGSINNKLMIDIMFARSMAISNGREFRVIPTDATAGNGVLADGAAGAGVNWALGWQVIDVGAPPVPPIPAIPQRAVRTQGSFGADAYVRSTGANALDGVNFIAFDRNGVLMGSGGALSIGVLGCAGDNASIITINQIGQVISTDIPCPVGFAAL